MSPLFNILSRFVIAFLPRSKCLLISGLQSSSAVILEPKKTKAATVSIVSPSICHDLSFLNVESGFFTPLSPSSRGSFSSPSLSTMRVVSPAYLRLLIFLLAILIPACACSPAFHTMHSASKLNEQDDNIQL